MQRTSYIDHEIMLQGEKSDQFARRMLQERLDERVERAEYRNIRLSTPKSELMHLIRFSSNTKPNQGKGVLLDGKESKPSDTIISHGVIIGHLLSFRTHAAGFVARKTKKRGDSQGAIHQMITSVVLLGLLWGSEVWWTGAAHMISQIGQVYRTLAKYITGLAKWTPILKLLNEAGLPLLKLLLDKHFQHNGMLIITSQDDHQCKSKLGKHLKTPQQARSPTGLRRLGQQLQLIFMPDNMEDPTHHRLALLPQPIISKEDKAIEGNKNSRCLATLPEGVTLLYTDGSKADDGIAASAWHGILTGNNRNPHFEGKCNIGKRPDIEYENRTWQSSITCLRLQLPDDGLPILFLPSYTDVRPALLS